MVPAFSLFYLNFEVDSRIIYSKAVLTCVGIQSLAFQELDSIARIFDRNHWSVVAETR